MTDRLTACRGSACTLAAAVACVFTAPASAQSGQLLSFKEASGTSTTNADDPPIQMLADTLSADFELLSPRITPGPSTTLAIPGQRSMPAVLPNDYDARCTPLAYRPRYDLPFSTESRRAALFPIVAQAACEAGLPVGLFDALVVQESRYKVAALSPKGAIGLAQLMPDTARSMAVSRPLDPLANLRGGARYLRQQLVEFGRVDLALAAYNAGPARVRRRMLVPAISETQRYVSSVTKGWLAAVSAPSPMPEPPTVSSMGASTPPGLQPSPGWQVSLIVFPQQASGPIGRATVAEPGRSAL